MAAWPDSGTLSTIASVIAAFSIAMIFYRVQREVAMHERGEIVWLPWADYLLLTAALLALFGVILPLVAAHPSSWAFRSIPGPACSAATILVGLYPVAILAHYRIIFGTERTGPRVNPEPAELITVVLAVSAAVVTCAWSYKLHAG